MFDPEVVTEVRQLEGELGLSFQPHRTMDVLRSEAGRGFSLALSMEGVDVRLELWDGRNLVASKRIVRRAAGADRWRDFLAAKLRYLAQQARDLPRCPKCGAMMAMRTAKGDSEAGRKFWGCKRPGCPHREYLD